MKNFYATISQKYRTEKHPLNIHPDGWARIIADDYNEALRCMIKLCGENWAFVYKEERFEKTYYPRGEMLVLNAKEVLS